MFTERCRKFGDLIVWKQVLEHSIEVAKGVVLVTDDKKEDWWEKFNGKTIGPHPELVKEFKEKSNNTFHMYQADRFLELAQENLDEQVSQEIVEEVREVMRRDKIAFRKRQKYELLNRQENKLNHTVREIELSRHQMMKYEKEMLLLEEKRHMLEAERMKLRKYRENFPEDERDLEMEPFIRHQSDYHLVNRRLKESKDRYQELQHRAIQLEHELARQLKYIKRENAAAS